ncbi:MAG: PQQ-binding-like beta-propeller repeat protein [bacterium]|nr:PQQ-binding-like beta-propeller repeat protein [bacterium]
MSKSAFIFLPLLLTLPLSSQQARPGDEPPSETATDWPQWRGPQRDATSPEVGLVQKWPADGPEVLWRVEVGDGYSGVVVAAGKLYTMWDEEGAQILACLDAASGDLAWSTPLGDDFEHRYGNGPRSTPLVDGDLVFAIGTSGTLLAADRRSGDRIWEHDLVEEFGARLPAYGYASSPLVVGDRLIVETAGKGAAYSAFDKRTGELGWSSQDDEPAYSSPILVTLGGVDQILFWSAWGLHSVLPDTGKELWRHPWGTYCPASGDPLGTGTPLLLAPDGLFLSSGSGTGVLRISSTDGEFRVQTEWESKVLRNDVNSSLLLGQHVYGFDYGTLKCIDVRTGVAKWEKRGYRKGSLIAADGQLIVLGERGVAALVDADPEAFVEKSSATVLEGKNWTSPTLAGARLYLRNHEELVCLNMKP